MISEIVYGNIMNLLKNLRDFDRSRLILGKFNVTLRGILGYFPLNVS